MQIVDKHVYPERIIFHSKIHTKTVLPYITFYEAYNAVCDAALHVNHKSLILNFYFTPFSAK